MSIHEQSHAITSTSDHTAGNWKTLYSNGSAAIVELALAEANAPFLSGGAAAAPVFGTLLFASAPVVLDVPEPDDDADITWGNNTVGIVVGSTGRIFTAYKNAADVYYVELTAI